MNDDVIEFNHSGCRFVATIVHDADCGNPWENSDCHGPVSEWTSRDKYPGERILNSDRGMNRYYNVRSAMHIAKRDCWGVANDEGMTPRQRAAAAVEADFAYLRGWCLSDWHYVGVCVQMIDAHGNPMGEQFEHALWGIESFDRDYINEVADDLAEQILTELRVGWREKLRKARERRIAWAA